MPITVGGTALKQRSNAPRLGVALSIVPVCSPVGAHVVSRMARYTHLTRESSRAKIARGGIRPSKNEKASAGVYAMPVLPKFYISHQWLRELRRRARSPLLAVDFVIDDDEPVSVGHFGGTKRTMGAAQAAGLILAASDPRGYEVIIPRAILPGEIARFRHPPQVVGWRYKPDSHGERPCTCPVCAQPGTYGAAKLRAAPRD